MAAMGFMVAEGRIAEIDAIADPEPVRRIATAFLTNRLSCGHSGGKWCRK
jgi:hypothetical protein